LNLLVALKDAKKSSEETRALLVALEDAKKSLEETRALLVALEDAKKSLEETRAQELRITANSVTFANEAY
jgi:hypothetical protein